MVRTQRTEQLEAESVLGLCDPRHSVKLTALMFCALPRHGAIDDTNTTGTMIFKVAFIEL